MVRKHCIHARHIVNMVRTPAQLSTVSMPGTWSENPLKRTCSALCPCQAHGKSTRPSAPAQHCIHARQHSLKLPLKRARSALYPCQAHGQNTRSSAPAQHCVHARHMVRAPAQVHPLSTVSMPGAPLKCRSALYPRQAHGKNTRSSAPTQHRHMVRTPAQLGTVSMPGIW